MDVKQAFLQSDNLNRSVYVIPPAEAELSPETVWKLRTAVYGLADASRQWFMDEVGLFQMKMEQAVFYGLDSNAQLDGIVLMHVDDFLYAGSERVLQKVEKLKEMVKIGKVQSDLEVFSRAIDDIEQYHQIPIGDQKFMPLTREEERQVRSVIGSLQ